jgi:hypothetical protein
VTLPIVASVEQKQWIERVPPKPLLGVLGRNGSCDRAMTGLAGPAVPAEGFGCEQALVSFAQVITVFLGL